MGFLSDLHIARGASLKPPGEIAAQMGIDSHLLEPYGEQVKKIKLAVINELAECPKAKYVVVWRGRANSTGGHSTAALEVRPIVFPEMPKGRLLDGSAPSMCAGALAQAAGGMSTESITNTVAFAVGMLSLIHISEPTRPY